MAKKKDNIKKEEQDKIDSTEEKEVENTEKADGESDKKDVKSDEETKKEEGTQENEPREDSKDDPEEEDAKTKLMRLAADFDNYKRRTIEERVRIKSDTIAEFAANILPILDNFERAIEIKTENEEAVKIIKGMEMVLSQFSDVLKKEGVEEIVCEGLTLDPKFHNAINTEKRDDMESNIIISVVQKGYKIGDKLIRPAMVVVSE